MPPIRPELVWMRLPQKTTVAQGFGEALNLQPIAAQLMVNRGIKSREEAVAFLNPQLTGLGDPFLLPDIHPAIARILAAQKSGEKVCVYGDYDIDGSCAMAILLRTLEMLKVQASWYVPDRLTEGFGLNVKAVDLLIERGEKLVICVDNGSAAIAEIARFQAAGVDVIVIDHHKPEPGCESAIPGAVAFVNPQRPDTDPKCYPHFCGAAVVHCLLRALSMQLENLTGPLGKFCLSQGLAMAGFATIGDIVPLTADNRILALFGLKAMSRTPPLGLRCLLEVTNLWNRELSAHHAGFVIGPRINAASRTGHSSLALELLLTEDRERGLEIAQMLNDLNDQRKTTENGVFDQALDAAAQLPDNPPGLVLWGEGWHHGVLGIAASRLAGRFYKPTLLLSVETDENGKKIARGSGRSIAKFPLIQAVETCRDLFISFGGHEAAVGITLEADKLPEFRERFLAAVTGLLKPEHRSPVLEIESPARLDDITIALARDVRNLSPFGHGNSEPILGLRGLEIRSAIKIVGDGRHLSFFVNEPGRRKPGASIIAYGWGSRYDEVREMADTGLVDLAVKVGLSDYQGYLSVQVKLDNIRRSSATAGEGAAAGEAAGVGARSAAGSEVDGRRERGRGDDRYARAERPARSDRSERGDRYDRGGGGGGGGRYDRAPRADRVDSADRFGDDDRGPRRSRSEPHAADAGDRTEAPVRDDAAAPTDREERRPRAPREDRFDRGERGDRQDRGDRGEREDRDDRRPRYGREERRPAESESANDRDSAPPADRNDRNDRNDRGDRSDRTDRPDRPDRKKGVISLAPNLGADDDA
ncbi:MAG: single-stranded-DNA-specific exonuclease RecJ [Planctomycetota bacterium]